MGFDQVLAVLVAAVCLALLVRLALGPARRARLDATFWRIWRRCQSWGQERWYVLRHGRASRQQAQQVMHDIMQRSRDGASRSAPRARVQKDGNVYTPDQFKGVSKTPKSTSDDPEGVD